MTHNSKLALAISLIALSCTLNSCKKIEELRKDPEIVPLQQGFKLSAAIGYCASLAAMAFEDKELPDNVTFEEGSEGEFTSSGLIYINSDRSNPIPFNDQFGQVIIGGLWNKSTGGGVISILFGNFNLLAGDFKFYGLYTIPVRKKMNSEDYITVFAEQDIVVGEGSDTILHFGLSKIAFDLEMERLDVEQPKDAFVAIKQNVWFVTIDQRNTDDIYDDEYLLNGGGQIAEVMNDSGGITYHALIETKFSHFTCPENPVNGTGFIQNIRAGDRLDLGNILLNFHSSCDGKAKVEFATGKYVSANRRDVNLNFR